MFNICEFEQYLSSFRKFISQNEEVIFWNLENLIKQKLY